MAPSRELQHYLPQISIFLHACAQMVPHVYSHGLAFKSVAKLWHRTTVKHAPIKSCFVYTSAKISKTLGRNNEMNE